jgi:hypothetical protein
MLVSSKWNAGNRVDRIHRAVGQRIRATPASRYRNGDPRADMLRLVHQVVHHETRPSGMSGGETRISGSKGGFKRLQSLTGTES